MTAIQTREPVRTPADAQTAGSRQIPAAVLNAAICLGLAAIATAAGFLTANDYVTCGLMVLCLVPFLTGPSRNRDGGTR